LLDFTNLKDKAAQRMEIINSKNNLQEYIKNDDTYGVYETIEQTKELENFKSFIKYHKIYDDTKQEALQSAKDGNTEIVHNTFDKYFEINYLEKSMSMVFKLSYLCEMKNAMDVNPASIHWLETVRRYTNTYGWDNEIISFQKEFGLEEKIMKRYICFESIPLRINGGFTCERNGPTSHFRCFIRMLIYVMCTGEKYLLKCEHHR
jgi:glutaredoxin-related protein